MRVIKQALAVFVASAVLYVIVTLNTDANFLKPLIGEWWSTTISIDIGGERIKARVRDTPKSRAEGLSGWAELPEGEGMIFVFPEDGFHTFWMKDMKFAIDIVWLSEGREVVDFLGDVSPYTYPEYSFGPKEAARYVLELPAGWMAAHNVAIGARVEF